VPIKKRRNEATIETEHKNIQEYEEKEKKRVVISHRDMHESTKGVRQKRENKREHKYILNIKIKRRKNKGYYHSEKGERRNEMLLNK
jgi:hypothetical protein